MDENLFPSLERQKIITATFRRFELHGDTRHLASVGVFGATSGQALAGVS